MSIRQCLAMLMTITWQIRTMISSRNVTARFQLTVIHANKHTVAVLLREMAEVLALPRGMVYAAGAACNPVRGNPMTRLLFTVSTLTIAGHLMITPVALARQATK